MLTGVGMFKTPVYIVWTTFVKLLSLPCQDILFQQSLKLKSGRTGGHLDRSWDVQDTCLYSMNNFLQNFIFPVKMPPFQLESGRSSWQEFGSWMSSLTILRWLKVIQYGFEVIRNQRKVYWVDGWWVAQWNKPLQGMAPPQLKLPLNFKLTLKL